MVPNQAVQMVKLHCRLNPIKLRSVCTGTEPDTERSGTGQSRPAAVCECVCERGRQPYVLGNACKWGCVYANSTFFRLYHLAHPASNSEHRNCSRCRAGGDDGGGGGSAGRQGGRRQDSLHSPFRAICLLMCGDCRKLNATVNE